MCLITSLDASHVVVARMKRGFMKIVKTMETEATTAMIAMVVVILMMLMTLMIVAIATMAMMVVKVAITIAGMPAMIGATEAIAVMPSTEMLTMIATTLETETIVQWKKW